MLGANEFDTKIVLNIKSISESNVTNITGFLFLDFDIICVEFASIQKLLTCSMLVRTNWKTSIRNYEYISYKNKYK